MLNKYSDTKTDTQPPAAPRLINIGRGMNFSCKPSAIRYQTHSDANILVWSIVFPQNVLKGLA